MWLAGTQEPVEWENYRTSVTILLPDNENDYLVYFKLADFAGNESAIRTATMKFRLSARPPQIAPAVAIETEVKVVGLNRFEVVSHEFILEGRVDPGSRVWISTSPWQEISVRADGGFSIHFTDLSPGVNEFGLRVVDPAGNEWTEIYTIVRMVATGLLITPIAATATALGVTLFLSWVVRSYRRVGKVPKEILEQAPLASEKVLREVLRHAEGVVVEDSDTKKEAPKEVPPRSE